MHLTLSVNLSARQFGDATFVPRLLAMVASHGIDPSRLLLELTESLLLDELELTIEKMTTLRQAGLRFSLDDFGTGYSSLAYLKRLPLHEVKIDRSFVRDLLGDVNDAVIVRAILAMGSSFGLSVIAEGVETAAQRDFLIDSGCGRFQGYLFGRPVPVGMLALGR
ncbi:Putative diguanylate cyclase/phosphodiesterase (GGDEF & EAL domains) with PAS/PAC and GAF sensor(s) [Oxalobacteraceae bacterium IMCC9480]|nr:Putative diguanylate cyclase/phosphodiesterase (GGDEF & EAL domains) with PAS/PAC and GAF sensor(s) [Oxalobacteraceae bacterium IMCC9480]